MPEQNGKEYKNPAYKSDHDESGQHDTRSASSTSSVKRFLNMKLKTDGRTRWIVLIVVICVLVLIIAAICAIVVVLNSESDEHSLQNVQADNGKNVAPSTTSTPKVLTSPRSAGPGTWRPKSTPRPSTQRPPDTTTPFVDLSTPKNLSAQISDIDFYPGAKTLTISCQAFHEGNLKSVDLRRQFKDGYEPLATILVSQDSETTVLVFPENISYKKFERKYEMLLRVTFDPFDCGDLTNFSCAVATEEKTESAIARITINNEPPQMEIPHSVIENKNISLECKVTLWGNESSLVWQFKPETSDAFMTFNVAPVNNITHDDCITTITTTLTFAPTMYEHGAEFRCQIEPRETDTRILRDSDYAGVILKVVPKTFCDDKRQFTINKHPFEPCSLVVYCLNTGPLVYEIVCDPGQCYDAQTTKCVDEDLVRSGSPIPPETVPVPTSRNGSPIPPETVPVPSVG